MSDQRQVRITQDNVYWLQDWVRSTILCGMAMLDNAPRVPRDSSDLDLADSVVDYMTSKLPEFGFVVAKTDNAEVLCE